jgi:hypothetical protein
LELHTLRWDEVGGWSAPLPEWDGPRTLVMAYGGSGLLDDPGPIAELVAAYPTSAVVGCSTAGEILADTVADDTLAVAVTRFAGTRVDVVREPVADPGRSHAVGLSVAGRLADRSADLRAMFVLSDGLRVNGSALTAGLMEGAGGRAVITGGLAGDADRFERTWVLADGRPRTGYVTAVGLGGPDVRVGHGSRGGWDIFGPERRVTRSAGNVLYELDGQPALELYKRYLGDRAAGLPSTALLFPLAVRAVGARGRQVVRTILAVDERANSMTFAGDVPEGSLARLMRANFDRLVEGALGAAQDAHPPGPGSGAGDGASDGPMLGVAVSCVGRRLLLGQRSEDELDAARSGLPDGAEMVGFYSYGEISPVTPGTCDLHNQTMTITTISEGG